MNTERKKIPIYSGVVAYFPLALKELAKVSYAGQEQHNPDKPLAWDRSKSGDELDALMRHLVDHSINHWDSDGHLHIAKVAWRAMAMLQKHLELSDTAMVTGGAMSTKDLEEYAEQMNNNQE